MDSLSRVIAARSILENVTPLKNDCGRYCGGACCQSDEDGQGGMLLFPGEEALYRDLPEGFSIFPDDSVMAGGRLLVCEGTCQRSMRPLSCRLFPLLPTETGVKMDRRGWAVCPLMEGGKRALNPEFVNAVNEAGRLLYGSKELSTFLNAIHAYNERMKAWL